MYFSLEENIIYIEARNSGKKGDSLHEQAHVQASWNFSYKFFKTACYWYKFHMPGVINNWAESQPVYRTKTIREPTKLSEPAILKVNRT